MNDRRVERKADAQAGFVLYLALMLLLLAGLTGGFFLYAARHHAQRAGRWHEYDQCLLDAQSALERVKYELVQAYLSSSSASSGSLGWFQSWEVRQVGSDPVYALPNLEPINGSAVRVSLANVVILTNAGYVSIDLIGAAGRSTPYEMTRLIQETLHIRPASGGSGMTLPFDYAYLLGRSGRLRDNRIVNGDIRVNGDFRLTQKTWVNGDRFASGKLTANSPLWSVTEYWDPVRADSRARPTDPPSAGNMDWPMGYVPNKVKNAFMPEFVMPQIDSIDSLAAVAEGRISQNGSDMVVRTYAGPGPDNLKGTADDGCLVLDGSRSPITIEGHVVVRGDVIIRGTVSGQGRITAGRNVHIVGDIAYGQPPAWPKPDAQPLQTADRNAGRDLLILAAKGNVVLGNYTRPGWRDRVEPLLADPAFIQPYPVPASDAALGYDSDNDLSNGVVFDGRYAVDEANGGRRLSGDGTNSVPRKYYESSLSDAAFNALCNAQVSVIDAALLTHHGIIGDLGATPGGDAALNGGMAARDEYVNHAGRFTINWDIRLGSFAKDRPNLDRLVGDAGRKTVAVKTIGWREVR